MVELAQIETVKAPHCGQCGTSLNIPKSVYLTMLLQDIGISKEQFFSCLKMWLEYGEQSYSKEPDAWGYRSGHAGYFSAGGWAYEILSEIVNHVSD